VGCAAVWTDRGLLPIADVQVGDFVLAHNDETGELSFREVLKTYVRQGAPIVLVTLMAVDPAMGNTLATIETTEEHPFLVEATANGDPTGWTRVDELSPGDAIKQFDGLSPGSVVVSIQFTSRREQVHNLEVEGLHTYLVGADGVVVHNGSPCKLHILTSLPRSQLLYRPKARGLPPIGLDERPIELHHPNANNPFTVREMSYTDHRGPGNYRANHPAPWAGMTPSDRAAYDYQRQLYWEEMWDSGRFVGLPSPP
jgi:hypothetical protein